MRRIAVLAILAGLAAAPAATQPRPPMGTGTQTPAPTAPQPSARPAAAPNVERGRQIAENGTPAGALACTQCHGMDGAANGSNTFPRIDGQPAYYLFKQLDDYASGARDNPIMSPIAQSLTEEERQDVAAYYGTLRFVERPVSQAGAQADVQAMRMGREIVNVGIAERGVQGCANCHGPEAAGLAPATPRLAGQWANYARAQFDAFRDSTRKNDVAAVMRDLSHRLTDDEIAAVSTYLETLQPARER